MFDKTGIDVMHLLTDYINSKKQTPKTLRDRKKRYTIRLISTHQMQDCRYISTSYLIVIAEKQYYLRQHNKTAIKTGYSWLNTSKNIITNLSNLEENQFNSFFWLLRLCEIIFSGQLTSVAKPW